MIRGFNPGKSTGNGQKVREKRGSRRRTIIRRTSYKKKQRDDLMSKKKVTTKQRCLHCGFHNHKSEVCKFKNVVCFVCRRKGHMASVCRSENVNQIEGESSDEEDERINSISANSRDMIEVNISIFNKQVVFQLDTGAGVSAIPYQYYLRFFSFVELEKDNTLVFGYGGDLLNVVGSFKTIINYNKFSIINQLSIITSLSS